MSPTYVHDAATCRLCTVLATGATRTRNGVEISPYCPICDCHHFAASPCSTKGLPSSICPRCRLRSRAIEDIPESARWVTKRRCAYCEPCLFALGYVDRSHTIVTQNGPYSVRWYEKPAELRETRDPFSQTQSTLYKGAR